MTGHHGTASGLSGKERTSGTVSICNNLRRQLRLARRPRQRPNRLRSRRPAGDKTTGALALRPGHRRPVPERLLQCHTRQIRCRPYRPRTVAASPVPVDVLSTSDLTNQGAVNLQDANSGGTLAFDPTRRANYQGRQFSSVDFTDVLTGAGRPVVERRVGRAGRRSLSTGRCRFGRQVPQHRLLLPQPGVMAQTLLSIAGPVLAQDGPYLQMDLGIAVASSMAVDGTDNDWGTKCDLLVNPTGVEVTNECGAAPPPTAWRNEFGGGTGIRSGVALGYRWGTFRLEGEYFHRVTMYNDSSDADIFDDVTLDKAEQEIELALGRVGDLQSHNVFANLYYDFASPSSFTPYVGVGVGLERAALDYSSTWKRNDDPSRITTFNDPALKGKIAGTTTIGDARLTDLMTGYQVLAGVDYHLSDPVTLGLKFRWVDFAAFESDPTEWSQLRSHDSTVGRGERIVYQITTDDSRFWGVSLSLKYQF